MSAQNWETKVSIAYEQQQVEKKRAYEAALEPARAAEQEVVRQFSRLLHEAHASGVSKRVLMKATKKAGNWYAFSVLWDAYTPVTGEFDHLNPAKVAAAAKEKAAEYRVESATYFEYYGEPTEEPEWLVLVNDAGDSQRVYVGMPKQLDLYARKYDNPPAAVDAAREHLESLGILTGEDDR